ncbi:Glycosyltransferase involved in cell wall bisynthesis [Fictibacillus solisalsi]|uniref:Glycosyltransferase involved in cell wall bisynthesis n=1 Tax=Fictibacillus solisalsi TaxID=459525 RepID=A0A1G9Y1G6_9BACL|nr:glycosyltransferase [Fictibacillus solisalsi]SDN02897.1 Glycosyltransferase involved in cell wall bisynthesis [Fictibacillus solisalsi]
MKKKVYMVIGNIDIDKGGITRVMLNRSRLLCERGYSVTLLTLNFKKNYSEVEAALKGMGRLHPDVDILDIHDFYKMKSTVAFKAEEDHSEAEEDYFINHGKHHDRYFRNGVLFKDEKRDANGELEYIDYYSENRLRSRREDFYKGHLYRTTHYHPSTQKATVKNYCTEHGFCYLSRWYSGETGELEKLFLFNAQDLSCKMYTSNEDFHVSWLNEMCKQAEGKPYVICDGPGSAAKVLDIDKDRAYRILAVHTNHFSFPHQKGSDVKKNHKELLDRFKEADALVLLTKEQKRDIAEQYGNPGNIYVIPHFVTPMEDTFSIQKDPHLVSIVSRLHEEKGLDEAIRSFKQVVGQCPETRLEIHGSGPAEEELAELIDELDLQQHVQLKGYCDQVGQVFKQSLFTVLTSKYEGLSLVIMESMANFTPVISYNIKYGPSDLIDHGVDGYLVQNRSLDELARYMLELLKNPEKAKTMGEEGYKKVKAKWNEELHFQHWETLFGKISH